MNWLQNSFCLFLASTLLACSSSGDSSSPSGGSGGSGLFGFGTLTLTGVDTPAVGTAMEVGDVAVILDGNGELLSVTFLDLFSIIENGDVFDFPDGPDPTDFSFDDPDNFFILTVLDDGTTGFKGISMGFGVDLSQMPDPQPYNYACTTPTSGFESCDSVGSLFMDKAAQTISFIDVTVFPGSGLGEPATEMLTLNGTLSWQ